MLFFVFFKPDVKREGVDVAENPRALHPSDLLYALFSPTWDYNL